MIYTEEQLSNREFVVTELALLRDLEKDVRTDLDKFHYWDEKVNELMKLLDKTTEMIRELEGAL